MLNTPPLAATSFMTGPDDDLITSDVYTKDDDSVVNDSPDADPLDLASGDLSVADDLRGGSGISSSLPALSNPLLAGGSSLLSKGGGISSILSGGTGSLLSKVAGLTGGAGLGSIGGLTGSLGSGSGVAGLLSKASGVTSFGGISSISSLAGPSVISRLGNNSSLSGIPGANSGLSGALSSILRNAPPSLTSALSAPLRNVGGAFASIGGTSSRISPANITSSYQMSGVLNNAMNSPVVSVVDHDSTSALISSLASSSMHAGIPNSFSALAPLAGGNQSILNQSAVSLIPSVISSGNIGALADINSTVNSSTVFSNTNVLGGVARNYTYPPNVTSADKEALYAQTTTTFQEIDPHWDHTERPLPPNYDVNGDPIPPPNGEPVSMRLTTIQSSTPDFMDMMVKGAMSSSDPTQKFYPLAQTFPATSPEDSLRSNFPMTAGSFTNQAGSPTDGNQVDIVTFEPPTSDFTA